MKTETKTPPPVTTRTYVIEGLDCADCARKIEDAVQRLPGVQEARVSLATERLTVTSTDGSLGTDTLNQLLSPLGYRVRDPEASMPKPTPWYRTPKGKSVLLAGTLLAVGILTDILGLAESRLAYTLGTLIGVLPLARKGWANLRQGGFFDINVLVTLAAVGALFIEAEVEALIVVFLFLVGELLESIAAERARASVKALTQLIPETARLIQDGQEIEVPASELRPGHRVRVLPGMRVPADGTILEGESAVDESMLTGEPIPVPKGPGDSVYAGTVNTEGAMVVRVERGPEDHLAARILRLIEEAEATKSPTVRFIDRFSRYYTPAIVGIALLVALLPPLLFNAPWEVWTYRALALLLIGCPCALVLSAPAAITSGLARAARMGLLIKGGAALERIGQVRVVALDKTGTLTQGTPAVEAIQAPNPRELLRLAAAVEQYSTHPLAAAIVRKAQEEGIQPPPASEVRTTAGKFIEGQVEGRHVWLGSPRYAPAPVPDRTDGTAVAVFVDGKYSGLIVLRDQLRPDARQGIARMKALGIHPVMLTGDHTAAAQHVARELGMDYRAELLPEDKLRILQELKAEGPVAFVGDGINDAPALAAADVGIAMGGGTDAALESADAALVEPRITRIADLIGLSRAALSNIRQNIAVALGLKAVFLVTTLAGLTGLWLAILADTGATLIVTANALRLLRFTPPRLRA
ncbi:heavy metal translocating P-type ATPase [Marinithermus hydrothermalis]|uniref:Heavy metal translocating P-type ATPase n=1 Tax=Marinithermus hydrothermalis (strain DSM 14884 / JCM 11576 / T1) TaxID=869210 RepID=F2NKW6_MARHT|nr:heavy metal translocating P-type ATPase [Marinithermus hydrothermalis]AEB11155.1 heavy metal translocating P-type ATPase [Marinithermus hydrothermalis DSM 14884]